MDWGGFCFLLPSHCCILCHHLPVTIHNKSPSSALKGYTAGGYNRRICDHISLRKSTGGRNSCVCNKNHSNNNGNQQQSPKKERLSSFLGKHRI